MSPCNGFSFISSSYTSWPDETFRVGKMISKSVPKKEDTPNFHWCMSKFEHIPMRPSPLESWFYSSQSKRNIWAIQTSDGVDFLHHVTIIYFLLIMSIFSFNFYHFESMHMVHLHMHIVPCNGIQVSDVIHDLIYDLISPIPKTHSRHPSPTLRPMSSTPTRSFDRKMVLEHPRVHIL